MLALALVLALQAPPPIVREQPTEVAGPEFGEWKTGSRPGLVAAYTNSDDGTFGYLCGETCRFYVTMPVGCNDGDVIPGLINSSAGAVGVDITCFNIAPNEALGLIENGMSGAAEAGGSLSLALPTRANRFLTQTFSLDGFLPAVRAIAPSIQSLRDSQAARQLPKERS